MATMLTVVDISTPRLFGVLGVPLPSPRLISNFIHKAERSDLLEPRDSVYLMQFGQMLDHDFLDTPTIKGTVCVFKCF